MNKPYHISPAKGALDTRADPDEVPLGGFRLIQNWEMDEDGGVVRMRGYRRLLDEEDYNNADLHDQLFDYTRQPINFMFSASSTASFAKLYACSQNRIYALNNATRNWQVISDELGGDAEGGCAEKSWRAAQQGNIIVFSNGINEAVYHVMDQGQEEDGQRVAKIRDLETLKVTKVGFVVAYNNFVIYCNLVQDGERRSYRAIWSDYKNALSIKEQTGSLAGRKDLDFGEIILNAAPMNNALWVYTNQGIWEVTPGTTGLTWSKRYASDRPGTNCLAYPNTLVSTGSEHYYFGTDGIYMYSPYVPAPERTEVVHKASRRIFSDINVAKCNVHHGAFFSRHKTIYWSWAQEGEDCPSDTLVFNTQYPFASYMGEGFSAFCNYGPDQNMILRDWLINNCICTPQELDDLDFSLELEGGFCREQTAPVCNSRPASFYTQDVLTIDDLDLTTEDYTKANADTNSLCARLNGATVESLCGAEFLSDTCNPPELFVMASVLDLCLKEWAEVYYRERCTNRSGCGTYVRYGYRSLLRSGAHHMNMPDVEKVITEIGAEIHPGPSAVPGVIKGRFGSAARAVDPNADAGKCLIMWEDLDPLPVDCDAEQNLAQYVAEGTHPNSPIVWPLYHTAKFFYYEIEVSNPNVNPPDTGAPLSLSRISLWLTSNQRTA
jgi:hypothetical protein